MSNPGLTLYLDTADQDAGEPLLASGFFEGLTSNPTLLQRAGVRLDDLPFLYAWATTAGAETVFMQTWGASARSLSDNAHRLHDLGPKVGLKVPATKDGFAVAAALVSEGVTVLITAVYDPKQMVVAAAIGAHWVAPYLGRLNDAGRDGQALVLAMHRIAKNTGSPTRLLVASLRSASDVTALAAEGVDGFTISPAVANELLQDDLTDIAVNDFDSAIAAIS